MRILIAEDNARLGRLLEHMMKKNDIQVDLVADGDSALEYALYDPYDVIVLDWMMPGQSGLSVCEQLRKQEYQGAILMLTAKDSLDDRVLGLDKGADDYLIKPFEFAELLARVRALGRRSKSRLSENVLQIGNLVFNGLTKCIQRDHIVVQLTSREFQLLDLLARNQEMLIPRDVILERIWGLETDVSSNNLDAYVRLLRRKMTPFEDVIIIQTVRGIGYKLEVQDVYKNS